MPRHARSSGRPITPRSLDANGLKGARIGVPSDPSDPAERRLLRPAAAARGAVMRNTIAALEDLGAVIVRANIPTAGWMGGPGTDMPVLNLNPESATKNQPRRIPIVFVYELKNDLNALFARLGDGNTDQDDVRHRRLQQGECRARAALRPGHLPRLRSDPRGFERARIRRGTRRWIPARRARSGIDAYMDHHRLDAVLFPGNFGAAIAAKAGYPERQVPAGFVAGADRQLHAGLSASAPPSPAAPGANRRCCALPTPSSRRPSAQAAAWLARSLPLVDFVTRRCCRSARTSSPRALLVDFDLALEIIRRSAHGDHALLVEPNSSSRR